MAQTPAQALGVAKRRISHRAGKWRAAKASGVTGESFAEALAKAREAGMDPATICYNFESACAEHRKNIHFLWRDFRRYGIAGRRARRGQPISYTIERILKACAWLKQAVTVHGELREAFGEWEPLFAAYATLDRHRYSEHDSIWGQHCDAAGVSRWSREGQAIKSGEACRKACADLDAKVLADYRDMTREPPELPPGAEDWSERRKGDRKRMADAIEGLAAFYGAEFTREDGTGYRGPQAIVTRLALGGAAATIDFDGKSGQPNVHVIPWHVPLREEPGRMTAAFGMVAGGSINPFHGQKCTAVQYGFADLYNSIDGALAMLANGTAFQAHEREAA